MCSSWFWFSFRREFATVQRSESSCLLAIGAGKAASIQGRLVGNGSKRSASGNERRRGSHRLHEGFATGARLPGRDGASRFDAGRYNG